MTSTAQGSGLPEDTNPYAQILKLQAQILRLQTELLNNPQQPPVDTEQMAEIQRQQKQQISLTKQLLPVTDDLRASESHSRASTSQLSKEDTLAELLQHEDSEHNKAAPPRHVTLSFPEARLSLLTQHKSRIQNDSRARILIRSVVDHHFDVVLSAANAQELDHGLQLLTSLVSEEDGEFSVAASTHSLSRSDCQLEDSKDDFESPEYSLSDVSPQSQTHTLKGSPTNSATQFLKAGPLNKKGNLRNWHKMFFGLTQTHLGYFKGSVSSSKDNIRITGDSLVLPVESADKAHKGTEFVLYEDGAYKDRFFHLQASTEKDASEWMEAIQERIDFDKKSIRYENRLGEMELYVWYSEERQSVHVSVLRARNLCPLRKQSMRKDSVKLLNPYIKLFIGGDRQKAKKKTSVAKSTIDPVWNESFNFVLDAPLTVQTLCLHVMNNKGKDECVAKMEIPLLNVSCDQAEAQQSWFPLVPPNDTRVNAGKFLRAEPTPRLSATPPYKPRELELDGSARPKSEDPSPREGSRDSGQPKARDSEQSLPRDSGRASTKKERETAGDVELSMWFDEDAATLHVKLTKARGLPVKIKKDQTRGICPYAKLKIRPDQGVKSKRTGVVQDCEDPVWNDEMQFAMDAPLTIQSLYLRVLNRGKKNVLLGSLEIPLLNVAFDPSEASPTWFGLTPASLPPSYISAVAAKALAAAVPPIPAVPPGPPGPPPPPPPAAAERPAEFESIKPPAPPIPAKQKRRVSLERGSFAVRKAFVKPAEEIKEGKEEKEDMTVLTLSEALRMEVPPQPAAGPDLGTIRICAWYDAEAEMLRVEVLECEGLPVASKGSQPYPYVELKTLPVDVTTVQYRTKVQKKTTHPVFNEKFDFAVDKERSAFKILSLSVLHSGGRFGKDQIIAEVLIPLDDIPRSTVGATQAHPLCVASSTILELHTLGDILLLEAGFESFLSSVTKEYSKENLLFWQDVQNFHLKFRDATFDQRPDCMSDCCEIFTKYIHSGAECEINIPSSIKTQITTELTEEKQSTDEKRSCEFLAGLFDAAQAEVLDMMSRDSFARYLGSKEWASFCAYLKDPASEKEIGFRVVNQIVDFNHSARKRTSFSGLHGIAARPNANVNVSEQRRRRASSHIKSPVHHSHPPPPPPVVEASPSPSSESMLSSPSANVLTELPVVPGSLSPIASSPASTPPSETSSSSSVSTSSAFAFPTSPEEGPSAT